MQKVCESAVSKKPHIDLNVLTKVASLPTYADDWGLRVLPTPSRHNEMTSVVNAE
jgi:hypothetical protein